MNETTIEESLKTLPKSTVEYEWFTDDELKERAYSFCFCLYPDSETYNTNVILNRLCFMAMNIDEFKFAYIKHDKEDCKPHIHMIIKYKTQRSVKSVLDTFDLQRYNPHSDVENSGVVVHSFKAYLMYMCHIDKKSKNAGKHEYPTDDITSNIEPIINNLKNKPECNDVFLNIIDFINEQEEIVTLKKVIDYCRYNDTMYMIVLSDKRYNYMITQSIKERNLLISN